MASRLKYFVLYFLPSPAVVSKMEITEFSSSSLLSNIFLRCFYSRNINTKKLCHTLLGKPDILIMKKYIHFNISVWRGVKQIL